MPTTLSSFSVQAAPLVLGAAIGFATVLLGLRQWVAISGTHAGRDYFSTLRRLTFQCLVASVVVTGLAGFWLGHHLPGHTALATIRAALWGLPFGLLGGLRWSSRRPS